MEIPDNNEDVSNISVNKCGEPQSGNSFLPDIHYTNKVANKQENEPTYLASTSNAGNTSKSLEESLRRCNEMEKVWDTKRTTVTLPVGPGGEAQSTRMIILEMNEFYIEMMEKLKFMRGQNKSNHCFEEEDDDDLLSEKIVEKWKDNEEISSQLGKIKDLDEKLYGITSTLKNIKEERLFFQDKICDILKQYGPATKSTENFLKLCNFDVTKNNEIVAVDNKILEEHTKTKAKKTRRENKNFITKNINLAKNRTMSSLCLTDEEKLKLESLLSDLDSKEYNINEIFGKTKKVKKLEKVEDVKESGEERENSFKLKPDEKVNLIDLEKKLTDLLQPALETGDQTQQPPIKTELDLAEEEGKPWKHQLIKDRLQAIDNELFNIQQQKLKEIKQKIQASEEEKTIVDEEEDEDSDEDSDTSDDSTESDDTEEEENEDEENEDEDADEEEDEEK